MYIRQRIFFLLLLLLSSSFAQAIPLYDYQKSWHTRESDHFLIHYHEGEESLSQKVANIAETQHQRLSTLLHWRPKAKTHIVLTDQYDFSNGWTIPVPNNHITLIVQPPRETFGLEDYDHWLELVFIHEYTHVLHLDMADGIPEKARNLFGRFPLFFPHIFQPSWFLEGLATHIETDNQKGIGRGQGALYKGFMAQELLKGLKPLSQINTYSSDWPGGTDAYLYGVYFYQFLTERYGEEKILRWLKLYSRQLIPFLVNTNLKRVFGKDLTALYNEFDDYLQQRFAADLSDYRDNFSSSVAVTSSGFESGYAQLLENGDLYYIQDSLYDEAKLYRRQPGKEPEVVSDIYSHDFDVHPTLGVLITQPEISDNNSIYREIYLLSPEEKYPRQLTKRGRYQQAIWDAQQQQILALHYHLGRYSLHRLDLNGKVLDILWLGSQQEVVGKIDHSPNGSHLVAPLWKEGSGWDLALFNLKGKEWEHLTHNADIEAQPSFSHDGASLVFSADYSGYYEIYQLRLSDLQLTQLTHTLGATHPQLNKDGTLYYSRLTSKGWDLHFSSPQQVAYQLPMDGEDSLLQRAIPSETTTHDQEYQGLTHLAPSWWFPYFMLSNNLTLLGASTSGNDPLYYHQYLLSLGVDNKTSEPSGVVSYRYDRWRAGMQVTLERDNTYYSSNDKTVAIFSEDTLTFSSELPRIKRDQQWALEGGVVLTREKFRYLSPGYTSSFAPRYNSLGGLAIGFNNSKRFRRSISPMDGSRFNLVVEKNQLFGGSYEGVVKRLDWEEYIRLGKASNLKLRFRGGWGDTLTPKFILGDTDPSTLTLPGTGLSLPPFNQFDYPLRGYPAGLPELRGRSMQLYNVELNLPLARIERTAMVPPIGIDHLYGTLFYDAGSTWDDDQPRARKRGMGVELHGKLILGYLLPLSLTLGAAEGIDEGGEKQYYLNVKAQF